MKGKFKIALLLIAVSTLIFLGACGNNSNKDSNNDGESNDGNSSATEQNSDLGLGDTALIESVLGDFEVTIESFEIHETLNGEKSEYDDHVFMIVDFTVNNVGDEILKGDEISRPTLFTEEGDRSSNLRSEESINHLKEELQAGEEDSGQMIFQTYDSNNFEINFGYGMTLKTDDVIWKISRNESN